MSIPTESVPPLTGSFDEVENGDLYGALRGAINVTLWGVFGATVRPERSFDRGATWVPLTYIDGTAIEWTAPISTIMDEPEAGVLWRLACTSYSSGTVNWRLSQ